MNGMVAALAVPNEAMFGLQGAISSPSSSRPSVVYCFNDNGLTKHMQPRIQKPEKLRLSPRHKRHSGPSTPTLQLTRFCSRTTGEHFSENFAIGVQFSDEAHECMHSSNATRSYTALLHLKPRSDYCRPTVLLTALLLTRCAAAVAPARRGQQIGMDPSSVSGLRVSAGARDAPTRRPQHIPTTTWPSPRDGPCRGCEEVGSRGLEARQARKGRDAHTHTLESKLNEPSMETKHGSRKSAATVRNHISLKTFKQF